MEHVGGKQLLQSRLYQDPGLIRRLRERFLERGAIPHGQVPATIERSWERCAAVSVPSERIRDVVRLSDAELRMATEPHSDLLEIAAPMLEVLYREIADTSSVVLLSAADGLILRSVGDLDFLSRAEKVALRPGVSWAEQHIGTNAIGTAIVERAATIVYGPEHYLEYNHFLGCCAAPIRDANGTIVGVLDITGDYRAHEHRTIALVGLAVKFIEAKLFGKAFPNDVVLNFHSNCEYFGCLLEAAAVFSQQGCLLAANAEARRILGLGESGVRGTFSDYFDMPFALALTQARLGHALPTLLRLRGGQKVYARIEDHAPPKQWSPQPCGRTASAGGAALCRVPGAGTSLSLDCLALGDERMEKVIRKAKRVLGKDIAILIQGESGTGKELLARAIHSNGHRGARPFVAVNCAAIPEGLIESELFGYVEGAFTNAKRQGNRGKIEQANGGTLFLDEIGDMPLHLQASLLRVLQERVVVPLGSQKAIPVDFAVFCATHRHLRDLVASGQFREDLYYRLNGIKLDLPPLRERSDLRALVHQLVNAEVGSSEPVAIDNEVMDLFLRHPWPGNIRQLFNVLRVAIALSGDDRHIHMDCLGDDFLDECRESSPSCASGHEGPSALIITADMRLAEIELQAIRLAMKANGGDVSAASRQLGISRNTLYRKLTKSSNV